MKLETLRNLYVSQLQDIYNTEKQIVASLPKLARSASNSKLKSGFEKHLSETKNQVKRLEQIFQSLGVQPREETSKPMIGLAAEGQEIIDAKGDADVLDAALISAAQKIEHYEIASYGTILAYAKLLGDKESAKLLKASLEEERATDKRLTLLAESLVNRKAVRASGFSESDYTGRGSGGGLSLTTILLGAAAGAAAGILLAPSTGQESRRKLVEGATALWDQWGGKASKLAEAASSTVKQTVDEVAQDAANQAGERAGL
ncbi:MAG: ferritin-like domain-containing protein [Bacteroidota bacterium]